MKTRAAASTVRPAHHMFLLFAAFAVLITARPSHGQIDVQAIWHNYHPRISTEVFARWVDEHLAGDAEGRKALLSRHARLVSDLLEQSSDYRAELERALTLGEEYQQSIRVRDEVRQFVPPPQGSQEWIKADSQWKRKRFELERAFVADVEAMLEAGDMRSWLLLKWEHRRADIFLRGMWNIEQLAQLMRSFTVCAASVLTNDDGAHKQFREAMMFEYYQAFDGLLDRFEEITSSGFGPQAGMEAHKLIGELQQINTTYVDRVNERLTPEQIERFEACRDLHLYPELLADTPAHMLINALREDCELTEDESQAVQDVAERFVADIDDLHISLILALKQFDRMTVEQHIEAGEDQRAWQVQVESTVADGGPRYQVYHTRMSRLNERRFKLITRTCRQLQSIFTDDRINQMPAHVRFLLLWHDID